MLKTSASPFPDALVPHIRLPSAFCVSASNSCVCQACFSSPFTSTGSSVMWLRAQALGNNRSGYTEGLMSDMKNAQTKPGAWHTLGDSCCQGICILLLLAQRAPFWESLCSSPQWNQGHLWCTQSFLCIFGVLATVCSHIFRWPINLLPLLNCKQNEIRNHGYLGYHSFQVPPSLPVVYHVVNIYLSKDAKGRTGWMDGQKLVKHQKEC